MNKNTIIKIIEILKSFYPDATCSLDFSSPFELGIAVMLSAQCTDKRVNLITPTLFTKYPTPEKLNLATISEIEEIIKPCGFYKVKAQNIKKYTEIVIKEYNGNLPKDIEKLMLLPGIGRKSANVIMLEAFNSPCGIAVDTHAKRISNRLGLSSKTNPSEIEKDLLAIIPSKYFKDVNHLLVWHGRNMCTARNPKCENCPIAKYCNFNR